MKIIKKFITKTKEGFSLANLQKFPSIEWGPEGGFQVDVLYNNKKIATVFQSGEGGMADVTYENTVSNLLKNEIKQNLLTFLKRYDYSYGKLSPFEWQKNKTVSDINEDDFESLVVDIECAEASFKDAKKKFEIQGVNAVADILYEGYKEWLLPLSKIPVSEEQNEKVYEKICGELKIEKNKTQIRYITSKTQNII